jgi:hypothetical protein
MLTKLEFSVFSKNTQIPNFMKIRPVGTELFQAETDIIKLIVYFRDFANAPINIAKTCQWTVTTWYAAGTRQRRRIPVLGLGFTQSYPDAVPPVLQQFVITCNEKLYIAERLSCKESSFWYSGVSPYI